MNTNRGHRSPDGGGGWRQRLTYGNNTTYPNDQSQVISPSYPAHALPADLFRNQSSHDEDPFLASPGYVEMPLDDFDREVLYGHDDSGGGAGGAGLQPVLDSSTPAQSHGTRSSALNPARLTQTPMHRRLGSSSSPAGVMSSPTISATRMRGDQELRDESAFRRDRPSPRTLSLGHAPPTVQGTQLVSTNDLPDRFRSVFPFPLFNAIQSRCFHAVYQTNDNVVVAAPTGGGKTALLELAICRLLLGSNSEQCKIVYQAPTKSLCSERQRDWQAKFGALNLQCAVLTGDTDQGQLRNVQSASIIITTPEKWDSMTRKWKDHSRLMQMVKLFLIDEVHILKDTRGATLEAVVSRMKSVGSHVRFLALSATVPNLEDVATWLGKDPSNQHLPAYQERFGEEFRPVRLQKFVYGFQSGANDFAFDKVCDSK
ncbi:MAG: Sec63 [Sclerophora amabilis]|nr:MAG: Sec63 [Sclerophora amabilis]